MQGLPLSGNFTSHIFYRSDLPPFLRIGKIHQMFHTQRMPPPPPPPPDLNITVPESCANNVFAIADKYISLYAKYT